MKFHSFVHGSPKKVHIAVNTRLLRSGPTDGIGLFTREIMKRLPGLMPRDRFTLLFDRPFPPEFTQDGHVSGKQLLPPTRLPMLMDLFFEVSLPFVVKRIKPDVLFSPDGWVSLTARVPTVSVVHDLNFLHHPEFIADRWRNYYLKKFPLFIRRADHLITVSEFSKNDLIRSLGVPPEKITVVYNDTAEGFRPVSSAEEKKRIQAGFSGSAPYFLHVGMIHERKNITGLLHAFALFREKQNRHFRLLVAGGKQWWTPEIQKALDSNPFRDDILFLGKVSDEDLGKIYRGAEALVFPSFFEGFGIPIVEAFKSGIPVITSDASALPEIAGGAALLIHPHDTESIASAMMRLAEEKDLRNELINRGHVRAADFSWDKSAATIAEILHRYARN